MILDGKPYTLDRIVRIALGVGLLWGLVWLLGYLSDVLIPFAVAMILAYLMNPLVNGVQKGLRNRLAAVLASLLLVLVVLGLLGLLVVPMIVDETVQMGKLLQEVVQSAEIKAKAQEHLPPDVWKAVKDYVQSEEVQAYLKTENFWATAQSVGRKILPGVWGVITGTASFLWGILGLLIIGLYLVFLLLDYDRVRMQGWDLVPPKYREPAKIFMDDFVTIMNRYFRGQAAVAAIVGVLFAAGFWIVGLPMGILLGLFIGLLNMVPYLQTIGLIPAALFAVAHALETGDGIWWMLAKVGIVFAAVQAIQDGVLVPRIMGKVTGLSPAVILLSLSIWGKLLGLFGLLIALPVTYLILAYYRAFLSTGSIARSAGPGKPAPAGEAATPPEPSR